MATVTNQQAAPPSSTAAPPPPPEDESVKRNTDCVYFLASPLTCKKGSECEYRHSEYARVNPRDCWYWLNGNCLNPKCSFRHPPLDSLIGPQGGNFTGPSVPAPPAPPVSAAPPAAKQAVPCIFFQKGYCLKGDMCPFLHGPVPPNAKIQQVPATNPPTGPPAFKKAFGGLEKGTQPNPKPNFQANNPKIVEAQAPANAIPKVEAVLQRESLSGRRLVPPASSVIEEPPRYKETTAPPIIDNGNSRSRAAHSRRASSFDEQNFQNGRDADDSFRESSPGFDVLVDDKLRDDEYYQQEDQYARMRGHDGRNMNEFEMGGHQDDYNSVADVDPEIYHRRRGYDSYDRVQDRYGREQHRGSSERAFADPGHYDRRGSYNKSGSPDLVQNSDLRHRLSSKQRRVNGLKSVVNPDYNPGNHVEDRGYRGSRRDPRRSPTHESSRSSRLQGRLKLPRKSPPVVEREYERGRNWGRLSPNRPQVPPQQGRLRDRLSRRVSDDSNEGKTLRGPVMRRDSINDNGTDFAAPKSLAELRGAKQTDVQQQQQKEQQKGQQLVSRGKLRDTVLASSVGSEGDLSFDGPKPLSEILKRKRDTSSNKEENKHVENIEHPISNNDNSAVCTEKQAQAVEEENKTVTAEGDEEEGEISNKKIKLTEGGTSSPSDEKQPIIEEGLNPTEEEEEGEEHELDEEYDQGHGEYEYEEDGEGFNLNEGETGDQEEDFMEEDDGDDDFAKKLGVSF